MLTVAAAIVCAPVLASISDYYRGKNVTYIVATNAGGGYDAYARLIGGYLEQYLNADHVIIRNVPGAGHIVGANTLARSKPDGLTIGTFNAGLIYGQLQGKKVMRFDLRDFGWIGKAAGEPRAIIVSVKCPIKTMQDLVAAEEPVIFAGAGIGSASYADTRLLSEALGLNIKIIPGYGGTEGEMAMMRGEICGQVASTSSVQGFVDAGHASYILTVGGDIDGALGAAHRPAGLLVVGGRVVDHKFASGSQRGCWTTVMKDSYLNMVNLGACKVESCFSKSKPEIGIREFRP